MRIFIFSLILGGLVASNLSISSMLGSSTRGTKRTAHEAGLEDSNPTQKKRKISSLSLHEIEELIPSANEGNLEAQQTILDYFQYKIDHGILFFQCEIWRGDKDPNEEVKRVLQKLSCETWEAHLKNYNPTIATLVIEKYHRLYLKEEYILKLPDVIRNHVINQANTGDASARYNLGRMIFWGVGVPTDYQYALRWYKAALQQGYNPALFPFLDGFRHHEFTYEEILDYCRFAAKQDYVPALEYLSYDYLNSKKDIDQGLYYLVKAASFGHPEALKKVKKDYIIRNKRALKPDEAYQKNIAILKNNIQFMMAGHDYERLLNDPANVLSSDFQDQKIAMPLLHPHFNALVKMEEKALSLLDNLLSTGYFVTGWDLKEPSLLFYENRTQERYIDQYTIRGKQYFCLGTEAIKKANKLYAIFDQTDKEWLSVVSSVEFLLKLMTRKSLLGKVINLQYAVRNKQAIDREEFNVLLSRIGQPRTLSDYEVSEGSYLKANTKYLKALEELTAEHEEGEVPSFKGKERYVQELEQLKNLTEHFNQLVSKVMHRNYLFSEEYPFLT